VKPCARITGSVTPDYRRATVAPGADRGSPPWRGASAAQPRRLLAPVRPGIGTDDAASGAHHARAVRGRLIRPLVIKQSGLSHGRGGLNEPDHLQDFVPRLLFVSLRV
jgi:hypothetical protein